MFTTELSTSAYIGLGILALVLVPIYFLPAIVASARGHHNKLAIFLLNLLLGWSFIAWALALVWAVTKLAPVVPRGVAITADELELDSAKESPRSAVTEDAASRNARLASHGRFLAWFVLPFMAILGALVYFFWIERPMEQWKDVKNFRSSVNGLSAPIPDPLESGFLVNGQSSDLEISGYRTIGFERVVPQNEDSSKEEKPEIRKNIELSDDDQRLLLANAYVESSPEFTASKLDLKVGLASSSTDWYQITGRCTLTAPADFPEGEHVISIRLPGAAEVRRRLNAAPPRKETHFFLTDDKIDIYVTSYSSRSSLYQRTLPLFFVYLLSATVGFPLAFLVFLRLSHLGWAAVAANAGVLFSSGRALGYCLPFTMRNLLEFDMSLWLSLVVIVNLLFFFGCWFICGDLRWSGYWAGLILPSMAIPLITVAILFSDHPISPFIWIPAMCLPGQTIALVSALVRMRG